LVLAAAGVAEPQRATVEVGALEPVERHALLGGGVLRRTLGVDHHPSTAEARSGIEQVGIVGRRRLDDLEGLEGSARLKRAGLAAPVGRDEAEQEEAAGVFARVADIDVGLAVLGEVDDAGVGV